MGAMAEEVQKRRFVIHPAKFSLWLFIVSIILLFGGLTSAYIVSKGIQTDLVMWHVFDLPSLFWYNSIVLVVSSVLIYLGVRGAKKGDFNRAKTAFILTWVLGVFFLIGQFYAWGSLDDAGVVFGKAGSTAGNYLYALTAVHGLHIIAGLSFLSVVLFRMLRNRYTVDNTVAIENCATFWHFLDLLWIYLFIFLLINHGV